MGQTGNGGCPLMVSLGGLAGPRYYICQSTDGTAYYGRDAEMIRLDSLLPDLGGLPDILGATDRLDPTAFDEFPTVPRSHVEFGRPLGDDGKRFGIGLNYAEHAAELDEQRPAEPASFFKPASAVTGPRGPIRLPDPTITERVTAEAELAVVIGRTCRDVGVADAPGVIAGYMPVIDMTAEDVLEKNPRYLTRAKSFDSFLVLGDRITLLPPTTELDGLTVRTLVDGQLIAENTVENMLYDPHELVAFHSRMMTLEAGDLISTGTPGAGVISPGVVATAAIDEIGTVSAPVVAHRATEG